MLADFPMMTLYTVQKMRVDVNDFVENCRKSALDMFEPSSVGYCGDHFFHLCREVKIIILSHHRTHPFTIIFAYFLYLPGNFLARGKRDWCCKSMSLSRSLFLFCNGVIYRCCWYFVKVATIARPPLDTPAKKGNSTSTGYIVSIFRVFEGDDREKLERNWLYWTGWLQLSQAYLTKSYEFAITFHMSHTKGFMKLWFFFVCGTGARTLYRHLPKSVGLRRITLHKSAALRGDKLYLLLCECSNFLENVNSAAQLLPALRARLCGYTGIYRVAAAF